MSQFTTELVVKQLDERWWKLLEGFEYHVGEYPSDEIITVPVGFITDFASVQKLFQGIISPTGKHGKAAVIHDYCYATAIYSKFRSDKIFLEAMTVLGVDPWKRQTMFHAVVIFGFYAWFKRRLIKRN